MIYHFNVTDALSVVAGIRVFREIREIPELRKCGKSHRFIYVLVTLFLSNSGVSGVCVRQCSLSKHQKTEFKNWLQTRTVEMLRIPINHTFCNLY